MSLEPGTGNEEQCPNCDADLRGMLVDGSIPDFCLKCRFPLMLVANKYRLLRKFDEGGFAIIYEAKHIRLNRDPKRVIKVIKPEFLTNESLTSRFFREVQVTSALSQRNNHIVRIYDDFGEIPNLGYFYVMEFLEGQPLNEILDQNNGLLPLELCYRLFLQLCDAMQAAHEEQIIHRDLKPHNLFIIKQGREENFLKVIDFGIAKPIGTTKEATQVTQGILGTPAYMAPEQCINKGVGAPADIYAMGCILYELLVGESPFVPRDPAKQEDISVMEIMSAHLNTPPPAMNSKLTPDRRIPVELEKVVQKALLKKPEERFASVEEFEQAFLYAMPDSNRPGSYLTSSGYSSHAQERLDRLPSFAGGGSSFQVEHRHGVDHSRNTPAPSVGFQQEPLPDLFSLPEQSLGNSFALEEIPIDLGDHTDLAIQPVLPGRNQMRTSSEPAPRGETQPPSRGSVRRVIEINRRSPEPASRATRSSDMGGSVSRSPNSPLTASSSFTGKVDQLHIPMGGERPSAPPRISTNTSSGPSRRPRNQVVYTGRPGVTRSPLKQPEQRNPLVMVLLLMVLLMLGAFFFLQTFYSHLFPWGQIFPWGTKSKRAAIHAPLQPGTPVVSDHTYTESDPPEHS